MGWGGRWEGDSGWGTHVNPWLIHVNVWQKPLQYCKIISLQLIKINYKMKKEILETDLKKKKTKVYLSSMLRAPTNIRKFLIMLCIFFLYLGVIDIGVGLFFAMGACVSPTH